MNKLTEKNERLEGELERVTFHNDENNFTIAKIKIKGQSGLVTVVGALISPAPGSILELSGEWTIHPSFGEQFKISAYKTKEPSSIYGIRKDLGSGLIKGLGPVMAKRIVKQFGRDTLDIISNDISQLSLIEGIGKKRIEKIKIAWDAQNEIREVMLFLQTYGISTGYASKIYKQYKDKSIEVVTENPYRLAMDIFGIGFVVADKIAQKLGFTKDSLLRAQAGIFYILNKLSEEGHIYYPYEFLFEKSHEQLEIEQDVFEEAMVLIEKDKRVVTEVLTYKTGEKQTGVFLARFHLCEHRSSHYLNDLAKEESVIRVVESDKAARWVQKELSINLAEKQIEAIKTAIENKIMVITGGPGTGKTTIINSIIKIYLKLGVRLLLCAPTGRAAKRMSEATGHEAKTIHRTLQYSFAEGGFKHNEKKPLNCDLIILDEASMLDTVLMYHLVKAIPAHATFILVGDIYQLPSVGAGNVLNDIISSKAFPVVELNEIFRQARESKIILNAHRINSGQMPFNDASDKESDYYFIEQESPEKILSTIIELVKNRIPKRFGFDSVDDIQVLTPMNKGLTGAENLNNTLQNALNSSVETVIKGNKTFKINDKVMQIRNNYDKNVFNGDIGRIIDISDENKSVKISLDGRIIDYDFSELDELVLAYAVTVHKSQGSEYPAVVIPVTMQHYMLLQRNLIYTGITRGKKLVVVVGTRKAMAMGVNNNKTVERYTYFRERLQKLSSGN